MHAPRIRLLFISALLAALVIVSVVFHASPGHWLADRTGLLLAPVSERLGYGRAFVGVLLGGADVVRENRDLKDEVERAHAAAARADALEQENIFLRQAAGFTERTKLQSTLGGVFSYIREGGTKQFILNRGSRDFVAPDDVVVTAGGSLVGIVIHTDDRHSTVRQIGDASLEVTARIAGTDISGLARVDTHGDLILDLVQKNETVTEGQTVVTSGSDRVPAGLVIGTVRSVDNQSTSLFNIVRITPAVPAYFSSPVLIIRP